MVLGTMGGITTSIGGGWGCNYQLKFRASGQSGDNNIIKGTFFFSRREIVALSICATKGS